MKKSKPQISQIPPIKAKDTRLLRSVAIKTLHPHFTNDQRKLQRLIKEAQTASSLNHPNICTIFEIEKVNGIQFIVMELIDGKT